MHEELEASLRELEAKLPDLRHLIADSGVVLTTSPAALVLAARLLRTITAADEVASLLRLTLLNSGELVDPTAQPTQPVPSAPTPPAPSPPEPPALNPAEIVATGSGLTDSDYALQEALGLIPSTTTSFDAAITELEGTVDELEQESQTLKEGSRPQSREAIAAMEARLELEGQLKGIRNQINAALDEEDMERVRELTAQRKEMERQLSLLTPLFENRESPLGSLAEKLGVQPPDLTPNAHEVLRTAFRLTGHHSLDTFDEIRREYSAPLEAAMFSYLRNETEAKTVTEGALEHGERVWTIVAGEVNFLELLASLAVEQTERLLPRPQGEEPRYIPTAKQVFRYLARHRVERLIEDIEHRLDHLRGSARELYEEIPDSVREELATLESLRGEVMRQFYNGLLRLDDDEDTGEGDAMGARITPPPPMRGPGATRTFDEALAPARV